MSTWEECNNIGRYTLFITGFNNVLEDGLSQNSLRLEIIYLAFTVLCFFLRGRFAFPLLFGVFQGLCKLTHFSRFFCFPLLLAFLLSGICWTVLRGCAILHTCNGDFHPYFFSFVVQLTF
jgi:hypothetical protein